MDKKPTIAQKAPYIMEMEAGKYFFCSCGKSSNQPFCNGSHRGSEFTPIQIEIPETKKVAWCGCKHSSKQAFCDGSHRNL